jgi:ABC-type dipeptide/oligopeptide/nickel transport system permease component
MMKFDGGENKRYTGWMEDILPGIWGMAFDNQSPVGNEILEPMLHTEITALYKINIRTPSCFH